MIKIMVSKKTAEMVACAEGKLDPVSATRLLIGRVLSKICLIIWGSNIPSETELVRT
jgi:hypothetical protein